ncbi:MAG TPA: zf-HC2 domain-containing protein [Steroidobacteraceae bacterium]|nr:zf-HC2 domain-containing protein [Steroidobacteraceae bacterium]
MERAKLEELIQAQLDGELSAAERAELARHLLQDAGARRLHDDYVRTDRLLREIPVASPPPELREAILAGSMARVRLDNSRGARRPIPLLRIAAAVVSGLLIVGLAYVVSDGRAPGTELQGSLQAGRGPEVPGPEAAESRASVQSEGITLDAVLRRDGEVLRLELGSAADMPVEVAVRFNPATTSFTGGAVGASLATEGDEIVVRLPEGRQQASLEFSGAAPLHVELRAGGRILGTAGFALNAP